MLAGGTCLVLTCQRTCCWHCLLLWVGKHTLLVALRCILMSVWI